MKPKLTNIMSICIFAALIPFVYVANKFMNLKSSEPPPDYPEPKNKGKPAIWKTTYPDEPIESFSEWSKHINKHLN